MSNATETYNHGLPTWILEKSKEGYSDNDLIDAYLQGKKHQKDATQKILVDTLNNNLETAKQAGSELFKNICALGFDCKSALMQVEDISKFRILFVIENKDFISDSFNEVYKIARESKGRLQKDTFYISYSFMPTSKELNDDRLPSDGFFLRYGEL